MANSDKNILITPSVGLSTNPTIKFNGANNTPTTLRVLDDGTVSFEGTAGQLFSISDGLTGSIFSVNDISGIPSIEVLDTGLVKLNQYGGSTVFGSSAAIQNASSVNAKVSISTTSATTPGLIIKGVSSQTANLQEWQNSAGTLLASVSNTGTFTATYYASTNNTGSYLQLDGSSTYINQRITNLPNLIIKAMASQTADLQQWQDSNGNTYAKIGPYGQLAIGDTNPSIYSNARISLNTVSASAVGQVIRGVASQTANLQEWQNSAGTVLAQIDAAGNAVFNNASTTNNINAFYGKISANTQGSGFLGQISAIATSASTIGMVIRGAASQTANLQEWQNSSGTALSYITKDGTLDLRNTSATAFTFTNSGNVGPKIDLWGGQYGIGIAVGRMSFFTPASGGIALKQDSYSGTSVFDVAYNGATSIGLQSASAIGLVIKAAASQTANLQEWQNSSGTLMAAVKADGSFRAGGANGATKFLVDQFGTLSLGTDRSNTGTATYLFVQSQLTTDIGAVIKGAASQTANLTEWQDSSGTILGGMQSNGQLFGTQIKTKNAYVFIGEQNSGGSTIYTRQTATPSAPGANAANLYFRDGTNAGTLKLVVRAGASGAETTILDNIPQS